MSRALFPLKSTQHGPTPPRGLELLPMIPRPTISLSLSNNPLLFKSLPLNPTKTPSTINSFNPSLTFTQFSCKLGLSNSAIAMRMIDLGNQRGPLHIIHTTTDIDCTREVRFRRTFRSLVECMVPCCGFQSTSDSSSTDSDSTHHGSTVTGTFFGYRKGRVNFCIQDDSKSSPLLLLEFAVPTSYLAKEMQYGLLRIALECDRFKTQSSANSRSLFSVPVWTMYCNGRKVGFAVRRQMSESDTAVFKLMQSVSVGAGVLPVESKSEDGDLLYLRASFERVIGSADSESFHMINPVGSTGQELSIFLLRS